jgi:hypothetical protein
LAFKTDPIGSETIPYTDAVDVFPENVKEFIIGLMHRVPSPSPKASQG